MVCHNWSCVIEHLFVMTQSDSDNKEQTRWLFLVDTSRSHQVWRGLHRWPPGLAAPPASSPCPPPHHPSSIHTLCQSCCQPEPTVAIARRRARRCIFLLGQSSSLKNAIIISTWMLHLNCNQLKQKTSTCVLPYVKHREIFCFVILCH